MYPVINGKSETDGGEFLACPVNFHPQDGTSYGIKHKVRFQPKHPVPRPAMNVRRPMTTLPLRRKVLVKIYLDANTSKNAGLVFDQCQLTTQVRPKLRAPPLLNLGAMSEMGQTEKCDCDEASSALPSAADKSREIR
jgi:hypothetical protein